MIKDSHNQRAIWHYVTRMSEYGEPETGSKEIRVRWKGKRGLVRDNEGREVVSEARVFCTEAVKPGDELELDGRRWPVIAVSTVPGLDGIDSHRECAV